MASELVRVADPAGGLDRGRAWVLEPALGRESGPEAPGRAWAPAEVLDPGAAWDPEAAQDPARVRASDRAWAPAPGWAPVAEAPAGTVAWESDRQLRRW